MTDDKKIVIKTTGDKIQVGRSFVELKGKVTKTLKTADPESFINHLLEYEKDSFKIFYNLNDRICVAIANDHDYGDRRIGCLSMELHPILEKVINFTNREMLIDDFEIGLKSLRKYFDGSGMDVYKVIRSLEITKIVSIERKKDNRGNCGYSFHREGNDDEIEWPEEISFTVPVFKEAPELLAIRIPAEFIFGYHQRNENVTLKFTLDNPEIMLQIDTAVKKKVSELFAANEFNLKFGSMVIHEQTDEWKYHQSKQI
jgi:hypothetical protein